MRNWKTDALYNIIGKKPINFTILKQKNTVNSCLKITLRNAEAKGVLKRVGKGAGANGSFKVSEKPKPAAKKTKKAATKKPAAKKTPEKANAKKPAAKKSPKKV